MDVGVVATLVRAADDEAETEEVAKRTLTIALAPSSVAWATMRSVASARDSRSSSV
jgi:hypothetical protein